MPGREDRELFKTLRNLKNSGEWAIPYMGAAAISSPAYLLGLAKYGVPEMKKGYEQGGLAGVLGGINEAARKVPVIGEPSVELMQLAEQFADSRGASPAAQIAADLMAPDPSSKIGAAASAAKMLSMNPDLAALFAFVGSPHRWDVSSTTGRFGPDMRRIGEGEGAQAFGYGGYSAEDPSIAKHYAKKLAGGPQSKPVAMFRGNWLFDEVEEFPDVFVGNLDAEEYDSFLRSAKESIDLEPGEYDGLIEDGISTAFSTIKASNGDISLARKALAALPNLNDFDKAENNVVRRVFDILENDDSYTSALVGNTQIRTSGQGVPVDVGEFQNNMGDFYDRFEIDEDMVDDYDEAMELVEERYLKAVEDAYDSYVEAGGNPVIAKMLAGGKHYGSDYSAVEEMIDSIHNNPDYFAHVGGLGPSDPMAGKIVYGLTHDVDYEDLLDQDTLIEEQPKVLELLKKSEVPEIQEMMADMGYTTSGDTRPIAGGFFQAELSDKFREGGMGFKEAEKAASDALNKSGIPGTMFFDANSRAIQGSHQVRIGKLTYDLKKMTHDGRFAFEALRDHLGDYQGKINPSDIDEVIEILGEFDDDDLTRGPIRVLTEWKKYLDDDSMFIRPRRNIVMYTDDLTYIDPERTDPELLQSVDPELLGKPYRTVDND